MTEFALVNTGIFSYLSGGLGFLGLALFLLLNWGGRTHGALLTLVCALNAIWCFAAVAGLLRVLPVLPVVIAEIVRDGAWLLFIAWAMPSAKSDRTRFVLSLPAIILPVGMLSYFAMRAGVLALPNLIRVDLLVFVLGTMLMSLWILILVEQLFRDARQKERWGLKYMCLAVATLFVYDFFMYSYSLLGQQIPAALWNTRGAVNALTVPLIVVAAARNQSWSLDVHVSRRAAFHTGALIVCGGYLLVMAVGGYFVRNLGGTWGEFLAILFVAAGLLLLLIMLLSWQVRARINLLINKHFFSYKYDYREEWLGLTERLNDSEETVDPYQRSIKAVAHVMESPAGALWLQRDDHYICTAHWNMTQAVATLDSAAPLAMLLRSRHWIVDIQEHRREPTLYDHLQLPQWLDDIPRARWILPLLREQDLLGFILLSAPRAPHDLTWEDLDLLKAIGRQVGSFLDQQESSQALSQARQFEAVNRFTAFLMHDLKNIVAQQSLVVQNAQKHKTNPEFIDDMILTIDSSVTRMKRLLQQLQRPQPGQQSRRRVRVDRIVAGAIRSLDARQPQPELMLAAEDVFAVLDAERLGMIVGHVVRNAQDATTADGRVEVRVTADMDWIYIRVEDDGTGMQPEFIRDALFQPFYTTKSSRGMGIGAYQAREFMRMSGGDVEVSSLPGAGTVFTLKLPRAADSATQEALPTDEVTHA